MDSLIFHNDRILPLDEARLSPGQTGLLMGWGVFTTLRLYRGAPFQFHRHWERMARDAARLDVPLAGDREAVRERVVELAAANRRSEGAARLSFIRNAGGAWSGGSAVATDVLIFTAKLPVWPATQRLELGPKAAFSRGPFAGAKMLSWAPNSILLERARSGGFDDILLLNERGHLTECTSANIFVVHHGRVLTPPLESGCLPGVTRAILLELAAAAGVEIAQADLNPDDLSTADEVFISSTTREVAPVSHISPSWNYEAPGKITNRLDRAFKDYIESHRREP